jgi:hypothetical protein
MQQVMATEEEKKLSTKLSTKLSKNQILKKPVEFFHEYLQLFGSLEQDYVLININHFKRAQYGDKLKEFLERIEPYYHNSKKNYVTRTNMSYMNFITVLRQISHMNGVFFDYKIKYTNSKHYIEYYFYIHRKESDKIEHNELLEPNV